MKISVLIPAFNSEPYIADLFECLSLQKYKNFEVIVMDNLSTDRTKAIVDSYSDKFRIIWVSEKDKGQGDAITKACRLATGKILHWHAADDFILPDAFQTVVDLFKSDVNLDLVFSDGLAYSEKNRRLVSSWPTNGLGKLGTLYHFGRFQSDTAYWRADLTNRLLPLRNDLALVVDEEFFYRMLQISRRIKRASTPLGVFRVREGQISQEKKGKFDVEKFRSELRESYKKKHGRVSLFERIMALYEYTCYKMLAKVFGAFRAICRKCGYDIYAGEYYSIRRILENSHKC